MNTTELKAKAKENTDLVKAVWAEIPVETKLSFFVSIAAIVHGSRSSRLFYREYSWKQTFSPKANFQFFRDHKIRFVITVALGIANQLIANKSRAALEASTANLRKEAKLLDELTGDLYRAFEELGLDASDLREFSDMNLKIVRDDSLGDNEFRITVEDEEPIDYDDPFNTEQVNDPSMIDYDPEMDREHL